MAKTALNPQNLQFGQKWRLARELSDADADCATGADCLLLSVRPPGS